MASGGVAVDTSRVFREVGGSIDDVRREIDSMFSDMRSFRDLEPDDVMRLCAGWSARLSELRVRIQRLDDMHRLWHQVRQRELEPALAELQNQFSAASRLLTARELDYKIETGAR